MDSKTTQKKVTEVPYTFHDFFKDAVAKQKERPAPKPVEAGAPEEAPPPVNEADQSSSGSDKEEPWPAKEAETLISDSEKQAHVLIEKAAATASEILDMAKERAADIEETARKSGYDEGYQKGLQEGAKEGLNRCYQEMAGRFEQFFNGIEDAVETIDAQKEACLKRYLNEMTDLVLSVVQKVIHVSLNSSSEVIQRMLVAEAQASKDKQWCKIYISASDSNAMKEDGIDILKMLSRFSSRIQIVTWEDAEPGTCILEFPDQVVDASVSTQLQNIRQAAHRFTPEDAPPEQENPFAL